MRTFEPRVMAVMLREYAAGVSLEALAFEQQASITVVRRELVANGAVMRPRGAPKSSPPATVVAKIKHYREQGFSWDHIAGLMGMARRTCERYGHGKR